MEDYVEKMQKLQGLVLEFLDDCDNENNNLEEMSNFFAKSNNEKYDLIDFLKLLVHLANYHHRSTYFFKKIDDIFLHFKPRLQNLFFNFELYNICASNKRIILFLLKEKMISIDDIPETSLSDEDNLIYFFDYLKDAQTQNLTQGEIEYREINRMRGENDSYICSLIQKDSVEDFISHVNRKNISLESKIPVSPYETNAFLIEQKNQTLIEYAAFYGSIQIFQYLRLNQVKLPISLLLYSIHGNNAELIHLLEENNLKLDNNNYISSYSFALKCHHNEIANYIIDIFYDKMIDNDFYMIYIIYSNYLFYPKYIKDDKYLLYSFCYRNQVNLAKILLDSGKTNFKVRIIKIDFLNNIFFITIIYGVFIFNF